MKLSPKKKADFQNLIWDFYKSNKRDSLPWRSPSRPRSRSGASADQAKKFDPYKIWISEVMLQQTQVDRVVGFFNAWMKRFPTVADVARAAQIDVLNMWKGLGYNSRAIRVKRAAEVVVQNHGGIFPKTFDEILNLPGIGPYTAGAIMAFAYDKKVVFIETNIRRVFIHYFFKDSESKIHDKEILELVGQTLPDEKFREWYWALMDYGAHLGRELKKEGRRYNPNVKSRHYSKQSKFEGSDRQIRSRITTHLLNKKKDSLDGILKIVSDLSADTDRIESIIQTLVRDGFIEIKGATIFLKK